MPLWLQNGFKMFTETSLVGKIALFCFYCYFSSKTVLFLCYMKISIVFYYAVWYAGAVCNITVLSICVYLFVHPLYCATMSRWPSVIKRAVVVAILFFSHQRSAKFWWVIIGGVAKCRWDREVILSQCLAVPWKDTIYLYTKWSVMCYLLNLE